MKEAVLASDECPTPKSCSSEVTAYTTSSSHDDIDEVKNNIVEIQDTSSSCHSVHKRGGLTNRSVKQAVVLSAKQAKRVSVALLSPKIKKCNKMLRRHAKTKTHAANKKGKADSTIGISKPNYKKTNSSKEQKNDTDGFLNSIISNDNSDAHPLLALSQNCSSAFQTTSSRRRHCTVYILLINLSLQTFEIIKISINPKTKTIAHLLNLIPNFANRLALGLQHYQGLCRPNDDATLLEPTAEMQGNIHDKEILIAIPHSCTPKHCLDLFHVQIKHHPTVKPLLLQLTKQHVNNNDHDSNFHHLQTSTRHHPLEDISPPVTTLTNQTLITNNNNLIQLIETTQTPRKNKPVFEITTKTQQQIQQKDNNNNYKFKFVSAILAILMQRQVIEANSPLGADGVMVCAAIFAILNWFQGAYPVARERRAYSER